MDKINPGYGKKEEGNGRYHSMDLLKFLGMLFVLIYHCTTVKSNILEDASAATYGNYLIRPVLSTCVPLFFFANGFLLIQKPFHLKKYLMKMMKFILLTGIWGAITLLFLMPIYGEWLSIKEFLIALWDLKQDWINHLWYMGALVCIYVFFPLIKNAFDHNRRIFYYWVAICCLFAFGNAVICMLVTFLSYLVRGGNIYYFDNFFNMFNPFRGLYGYTIAYFSIGCFAGGNHLRIKEKIQKCPFVNPWTLLILMVLSVLLLGLWGVFSTKLTGNYWDVVWNGYDSIFTLMNVILFYLLSYSYRFSGRGITKYIQIISRNTLGIYFIHDIFRPLFLQLGVTQLPFANTYLFNILYAFIVMNLSLLVVKVLKQIPFVRKLVT